MRVLGFIANALSNSTESEGVAGVSVRLHSPSSERKIEAHSAVRRFERRTLVFAGIAGTENAPV